MSTRLYTDEELLRIANPIVEVRAGLHARRPGGNGKSKDEIRREVYRVVTAVGLANRAACALDSRNEPPAHAEVPRLDRAEPAPPNGDTLSLLVAKLLGNCISVDPGSEDLTTKSINLAPATQATRLIQWAAAIDQATFDALDENAAR